MPHDRQDSIGRQSYNTVFERLVGKDGDPDLVGMVAYALYKMAKREWVKEHQPTEADRQVYHKTVTAAQIEMYKSHAEKMLTAFAEEVLEETATGIREEAQHAAIVQEVKRQNKFWINALASVVGSVLFAALLFVMGILFFAPGVKDFLIKVAGN